ncbi:MAG: hypothetical protein AAFX06_23920 [Planctomycetota bacterium]
MPKPGLRYRWIHNDRPCSIQLKVSESVVRVRYLDDHTTAEVDRSELKDSREYRFGRKKFEKRDQ